MTKNWLIAAALVCIAGTVPAAVLSNRVVTGNFQLAPGESTQKQVEFEKFDASLGTLTRVTLNLEGYMNAGAFSISNTSAATVFDTFTYGADILIADPNLSESRVFTGDRRLSLEIPAHGVHSETNMIGTIGESSVVLTDAIFVNSFIGAGNTAGIMFFDFTGYGSATAGSLQVTAEPFTVNARLWIVYEYNAVPEPANVMLGAAGILLAVVVRWFKNRA